MSAGDRSQLTIDTEAIWRALAASKQLDNLLKQIVEEIAQEAQGIAREVAYDEGYLAGSYRGVTVDAAVVRNFANATNRNSDGGAGVNRRRRGQRGTNQYLDWFQTEGSSEPPTAYQGRLGVVVTDARTAVLIEYGSIANAPKRVLWTACERVAGRYGLEATVLYNQFKTPDSGQLSAAQKAGWAKRTPTDEGGGES